MHITGEHNYSPKVLDYSIIAIQWHVYRFVLVDIGDAGCQNDSGVLANSCFGQAFEANALGIPKPSPLPGCMYA